jgi:predicted nucleotidyltransferase
MIVQNKQQLIQQLADHRADLDRLGVARLGLFGSFRSGAENESSDVDMIVEFEKGRKSFDSFMELAFLLEDIFGRKVELLTPESLSKHLGPKILSEVEYGLID